MRIVVFLVVLSACGSVSQALADDETFDVPSGQFTTKYSGALVPGTIVSCDFTVDEAYFGTDWTPMVSILFEADEETPAWATSYKLLAFHRSDEDGWRHELDIAHGDERESRVSMYSGLRETVLSLNMWLTDDEAIFAFVGDDPSHVSIFDVSDHSFLRWQANVSGVRGSGDCDSQILGGDDDEDEDTSTASAQFLPFEN